MQIANALNNIIRILFNPKIESFTLFDFLIVKSGESRYLAQIVEIYDDKFDSSQNVAKLKLFYKIAPNNEVMPYDNFTPNKECEIVKIDQREVEDFVNTDKKTFIFGTNTKSSSAFNLQYEFFDKNAIILADKIENSCVITNNLAKNLSQERPVVVIDSTGIMDFDNSKVIKAGENFKLPLNSSTINFIFDKCLSDATLEFQTIAGDIINELKKFAKKQDNDFIPFGTFVKVILEQYKVTPFPELKLLVTRLKKFQLDEIFARTKKDSELLNKTIDKNEITVVDLSAVDTSWQKAFLEYIVQNIEQEIYLLARFNGDNCDSDLIHVIYNQKKNIKLVPNVSYNYKKLPTIIQYCTNYILLPSLYQRSDFLDANFALSNLISDGCIVFGENTDNFLYCIKDYSIKAQEKRKNYRKIALSMVAREDDDFPFDEPQKESQGATADSKKLMDELTKFEEEQKAKQSEDFDKLENPIEEHDDFDETDEKLNLEQPNEPVEKAVEEIEPKKEADFDDILEIEPEELEINFGDDEPKKEAEKEPETEIKEVPTPTPTQAPTQAPVEIKEEIIKEEVKVQPADEPKVVEQKAEEPKIEPKEIEIEELSDDNSSVELSDEELDFFEQDEKTIEVDEPKAIDEPKAEIKEQSIEETEVEKKDDIDLSDIASNSIDESFEHIINTKNETPKDAINIDDKTTIIAPSNLEQVNTKKEDENLPIFKEELREDSQNYAIGDTILHKNYGKGKVVKLVQYEDRQLLQIEFEEAGKKLLDPKVADITLEQ